MFDLLYTTHMKRTNLVLNEHTLKTATHLLGAKTYSEAVNRALEDAIRLAKLRGLVEIAGEKVWSGDLAAMREDSYPKKKPSKR